MTTDTRELVEKLRNDAAIYGTTNASLYSEAASTIESLSEENRLLKLAVGFAQTMLASHGHADEAQKIRDLTKEQTNG